MTLDADEIELIELGLLAADLKQLPSAILNERADHIWAVLGVLEQRAKIQRETQ